jgi:cytochrome c-type biogenesis protein CcmH/NrfG
VSQTVSGERLSELENERDFLLRSLEDLEEEYGAGEVSDDDYSRLKDSYTARAAEVLRTLQKQDAEREGERPAVEVESHGAAGTHPKKRKGRNGWLLVGGIALVLAGIATALIASNTGSRLPGNTATGGVSLAPAQEVARELDQASVLEQGGNYAEAIQIFDEVLAQQPDNVDALASAGWLEFEAGVLQPDAKSLEAGETEEQKAVSLDPAQPVPHAYLGTMLFVEGQSGQAVVQFGEFIAAKPSGGEVAPFVPDMKKAFSDQKIPLPALPAGS